jgi:hypothetical protein
MHVCLLMEFGLGLIQPQKIAQEVEVTQSLYVQFETQKMSL